MRRIWFVLFVGVLACLSLPSHAEEFGDDVALPDAKGTHFEGRSFRASLLAHQVTIFGAWKSPSGKSVIRDLFEIEKAWSSKGLKVFGVDYSGDRHRTERAIDSSLVTFPVLTELSFRSPEEKETLTNEERRDIEKHGTLELRYKVLEPGQAAVFNRRGELEFVGKTSSTMLRATIDRLMNAPPLTEGDITTPLRHWKDTNGRILIGSLVARENEDFVFEKEDSTRVKVSRDKLEPLSQLAASTDSHWLFGWNTDPEPSTTDKVRFVKTLWGDDPLYHETLAGKRIIAVFHSLGTVHWDPDVLKQMSEDLQAGTRRSLESKVQKKHEVLDLVKKWKRRYGDDQFELVWLVSSSVFIFQEVSQVAADNFVQEMEVNHPVLMAEMPEGVFDGFFSGMMIEPDGTVVYSGDLHSDGAASAIKEFLVP